LLEKGDDPQAGARPAAPVRRPDPPGQPRQAPKGDGMEGRDSLRAHPDGARRLLAAADSRLHPLSAPGGLIRLPPAPGKVTKVALVHDWLTGMRGGERCLEVFCELFPEADLFTLLHVPGSVPA